MASPKTSRKRRSLYGNRQSLSVPCKSFCISVTNRVKYKYTSFDDERNNTFHPDSLLLITHHTWNLYRVSHLNNVEYSTVKLKQYAACIKHELVKNIKNTATDITFSAKVEVLPELKESNDDCSSLKIEVFYKKEDNKPALKYRGILLSWGNNNSSNILTQLPLLLCVGAINITRIVHRTLSTLFDTLLRPLRISEDDLMWLSAMLSVASNDKNISYNFSLNENTVTAPIIVSLPCTLVKDLWNKIHLPESEEIDYHEVQNYHKHLQEQLRANFGINFKLLKLNKITMCDATIASEGKIKIYSEDATVRILSFINEVSLLLDSSCPEISDEISNNTL